MDDLKLIKKYYGEKMSHLCRDLFPSILETEGLLFRTIADNFNYSKFLYDDLISCNLIESFKKYIYSLLEQKEKEKIVVDKNPYELMEEAGYTLYKCETEEDIQRFKKYYASGETLCTFCGGRLNSCHVFFAVKKNVDEIKRENFERPFRQDEYGTSVISIQFSKGSSNYLSIKNRYNHTVLNPDATFSNNLENIIPGLTNSFEREFGYKIEDSKGDDFEIPYYVKAADGKRYKYNYEFGNVYYCTDNIIIENGAVKEEYLDKNKYLVFGGYVLNLHNKRFEIYNNHNLDFFSLVMNEHKFEKVEIKKRKDENKDLIFIKEDKKIVVTLDKRNRIIEYYDEINYNIPSDFLYYSESMKRVILKEVNTIEDCFCSMSPDLISFIAPKLKCAGDAFLSVSPLKEQLYIPKIEELGDQCLEKYGGTTLCFPYLKKVGSFFLTDANFIENASFPSLTETGSFFMTDSFCITNINIPNVRMIGKYSLKGGGYLKEISVPFLYNLPDRFLERCINLKKIYYPYIETYARIGGDLTGHENLERVLKYNSN